jgi:hypothetical protein
LSCVAISLLSMTVSLRSFPVSLALRAAPGQALT